MKKNSSDPSILTTLCDFMEQKSFSVPVLDKMLGSYVVFEFDGTVCKRRQASDAYFHMIKERKETAESKQDLLAYIHKEERDQVRQSLFLCMEHEKEEGACPARVLNYRRICPDGRELWISMELYLLSRESNTAVFCSILHDISEAVQKSYEAESRSRERLEHALVQAKNESMAKMTLLSNMSHDIRTPINAVMGFSAIAAKHIDEKERVLDCLGKITVSGNHLLGLIDDILDMSRMENGKLTLDEKSYPFSELLDELFNIVQPQIAAKGLNFQKEITAQLLQEEVLCDKLRFQQIFLNLFSNAIKFTEPGGTILFSVRQWKKTKGERLFCEFRVKDNGIGMSREFQSHIFEAFERERTENGIQGTGLGMAITKNLVDKMGGSIAVESEPGKGTEFLVKLDLRLQKGQKEKTCIPEKQVVPERFAGKRVLLVEDNELNREIARELLADAGFLVEEAENGRAAVENIQNAKIGYYDLVLMDVQMPVMNGYEATGVIRGMKNKEKARIPIVAMTANAFETDKHKAIQSGMDAYISKPICMEELLGIVQGLLNRE